MLYKSEQNSYQLIVSKRHFRAFHIFVSDFKMTLLRVLDCKCCIDPMMVKVEDMIWFQLTSLHLDSSGHVRIADYAVHRRFVSSPLVLIINQVLPFVTDAWWFGAYVTWFTSLCWVMFISVYYQTAFLQ